MHFPTKTAIAVSAAWLVIASIDPQTFKDWVGVCCSSVLLIAFTAKKASEILSDRREKTKAVSDTNRGTRRARKKTSD